MTQTQFKYNKLNVYCNINEKYPLSHNLLNNKSTASLRSTNINILPRPYHSDNNLNKLLNFSSLSLTIHTNCATFTDGPLIPFVPIDICILLLFIKYLRAIVYQVAHY